MKLSRLVLLSLFALAALAPVWAEDALALTARVAAWQLSHPVSFDIRWQEPGKTELVHVRLGWDGEILRRRQLPAGAPDAVELPAAWTDVARQAGGDIAFGELPAAAQAGWREKVGLDPKHIIGLKLMDEGGTRGWEMATFYVGLLALSDVAAQPVYRAALRRLAEAQHWQLGARARHADDLLVGYTYLDFYAREKKDEQLAAVQSRLEWLQRHPSSQSLDIRDGQDRWTWCDALFMAPPVWLRAWQATGDRAYLDYMDREWWATTGFLYVPEEKLFFRDAKFFDRREPNGQRIFWSRGNGWVLASLALMLPDLPADLPSRPRYVALFQEMAARIAALQPADGLWRSSLLDASASPQPEASSSAFFCYAFARGIRLGLLDADRFGPVVDRTWTALAGCVAADGRLGYVQQPGAAPGSADANSTAPYGVGAFLLAGSEVHLLRSSRSAASSPERLGGSTTLPSR